MTEQEIDFEKLAQELAHLSEQERLAFAEFLFRTNRDTAKAFMDSIGVAEQEDYYDNYPV